ncbi:MAG: TetR/AcrR family transcriptional regulator [Actinobacteria bacterium]|nr:TetR/AcrR family transcriptional regulator [Actinomycetota bacterium]MCG2803622.1 TetR/AcrR family transcriptional regulator [Cellulomonas sp.]
MPQVPEPAVRAGRASPLPPDERRQAILAAVQDVILERGTAVTTRDLAAAAGVAEGTLFRVFEDKTTLLREAVLAAIDPGLALVPMRSIDLDAPLEERIIEVMRISQARVERTVAWMSLLHQVGRPGAGDEHHGPPADWQDRRRTAGAAIRAELIRLLTPDEARLRLPPHQVADLLATILVGTAVRTVESARSGGDGGDVPAPQDVAAMFLSGVVDPDSPLDPHDLVPEGSTPC